MTRLLTSVIVLVLCAVVRPSVVHGQDLPVEPEPSASDAVDPAAPGTTDEDLGDLEALLGEQVVTTASRSAELASAAPATVQTIDGDSIRRYGMRSLDEILSYLGLGIFTSDSGRDYTSGFDVGVQGLLIRDRGRHVLLLVDGHVMNSQSSGDASLDLGFGVPLEMIDHVEVMLGPASVVYGSNAMQAVVNVVSRRARDYGTVRVVAEGSMAFPTEGGSRSHLVAPGSGNRLGGRIRAGAGFSASGRFGGSAAEVVGQLEWIEHVDPTSSIPYQNGEFFDVRPGEPGWGGTAAGRRRSPSGMVTARLGRWSAMLQGNTYRRTMPFVGTFDDPDAHEQSTAYRGEIRNDAPLSDRVTLQSRVYGDHVRLDERSSWTRLIFCVDGQIDGCDFRRRNASSWVGAEERVVIDWKVDGRITTTIGGDIRLRFAQGRPADYRDAVTNATPYTVELPYWRSTSVLGAVFVQQTWQPVDALILNVGARFDADSLFGVRLSPRAVVAFLPDSRTTVRVGYTEAFRAPSALELNDTDPTYVVRPSSLGAETVRNVELELSQRFAKVSYSVRAFASFFDDLLNQRTVTMEEYDAALARGDLIPNADPDFVTRWDNLGRIRILGGTASFHLTPIDGLEIGANATVADNAIANTSPSNLPIIPRFYGNARVSYRFGPRATTLSVVGTFSSNRVATNEQSSGFEVLRDIGGASNLRVTASGDVNALPGFSWRAAVDGALHSRMPYVFSPGPDDSAPGNTRVYAPMSRLTVFVGLQYARN